MRKAKKRMGRPPGRTQVRALNLRVDDAFVEQLDQWRMQQPAKPNRTGDQDAVAASYREEEVIDWYVYRSNIEQRRRQDLERRAETEATRKLALEL
jgi:hypothetical protein